MHGGVVENIAEDIVDGRNAETRDKTYGAPGPRKVIAIKVFTARFSAVMSGKYDMVPVPTSTYNIHLVDQHKALNHRSWVEWGTC